MSQQGRRHRGPMARLVESRGIPTKRRLLTFVLDTVDVAYKGQPRRCSLYWRVSRPEEAKVGGASVARRWRRAVAEGTSYGWYSLAQKI